MVNNCQQLKEKLGQDLKSKIESVDQLLSQLKLNLEDVEANCAKEKDSVQKDAEKMILDINLRKLNLMKELDNRAQIQNNKIMEKMQLAYLTLGSLQSMLTNLDSFDNRQLLNLQVPITASLDKELNIDSLAPKLYLDARKIHEEIGRWGTMNNVNAASEVKSSAEFNVIGSEEKLLNQTIIVGTEIKEAIPEPWKIENWLSYDSKSTKSSNEDDFEMLAMDINTDDLDDELPEPDAEANSSTRQCPEVPDVDNNFTQPVITSQVSEELSKWLKPKNVAILDCQVPTVPADMIQKPLNLTSSKVSTRNHLLDFPGLRLDPKCWLHQKKNERFKISEEIRLKWCQKQIIPPTLTLPYPFWLKKC